MNKDYYKILGVSESATSDDISKAFKKLAMKYHPDRNKDNKDAEQKFKEVNEAYSTLKDEKSRAEYDNMRKFGTNNFNGFSGMNFGSNPFTGGFNFDSFMNDFFTGFNRGGFNRRPVNVDEYVSTHINYRDLLTQSEYTVTVGKNNVKVKIPKNIRDGQTLRIKGGAYNNSNYDAGDLFVTVNLIMPNNYRIINGKLVYDCYVDVLKTVNEKGETIIVSEKDSIDGKKLEINIDNSAGGELKNTVMISSRGLPIPNIYTNAPQFINDDLTVKIHYMYYKE